MATGDFSKRFMAPMGAGVGAGAPNAALTGMGGMGIDAGQDPSQGGTVGSATAPVSLPSNDAAAQIAEPSPENPQEQTAEEQMFAIRCSVDDANTLVEIIGELRAQWAPDRLLRLAQWQKNTMFYRGQQVLAWDRNSNAWFNALAWYQQNRSDDGEATTLDKYINNITLMLGTAFIGTMSRGVPQTVVKPENAEILADATTAKAGQEAIAIIERRNRIRAMVRSEFEYLYLYGTYFKYTRGVLDGNWSGYDEEPMIEDQPTQLPDRMQCFGCGKMTPVNEMQDPDCPGCGTRLTGESYYPAETKTMLQVTGIKRTPRAMVRQSVHSPQEIDVDPQAKSLSGTSLLAFDQEIDIGEARQMFPIYAATISDGTAATTTPNADFERLRRNEVYSMGYGYTSDAVDSRPTYSQVWLQPSAFWRRNDAGFAQRMMKAFPDGVKLSMIGATTVDVRNRPVTKDWTTCRLRENFGLLCTSIAENVVPFNERFNSAMQTIDDWANRCPTGINFVDGSRIDKEKMTGQTFGAGALVELPMKINGEFRPLGDAILHYDMPIAQQLMNYPSMLLTFAQMIGGTPPQSFGNGTQPGVETAAGQRQQLDQSNMTSQPYWENVKEEHALAAQNAIECLQSLLKCGAVKELWEVVEANGSEFRNNYVNLAKMQGRIKVYPDEDQNLPETPEQIRQTYQMIFEQVGKGNPAAQALFDVPSNQESIMSVLASPELVVPIAAQRAKTLQDINTLLSTPGQNIMQPDGSVAMQLPIQPEASIETFPVLKETMRLFLQENCDLRVSNPEGWKRCLQYLDAAEDMDAQVAAKQATRQAAVTKAGQPVPPQAQGPNPQMQQILQQLMQDGSNMVARLQQMATMDPMQTGGTITGQVAAANHIVDAGLKAQQAMAS
jgi:hypothetical protein